MTPPLSKNPDAPYVQQLIASNDSNCGITGAASLDGKANSFTMLHAYEASLCADTRGGKTPDDKGGEKYKKDGSKGTGDGAGIITGIPHEFLKKTDEFAEALQGKELGDYGVGHFQWSTDETQRQAEQNIATSIFNQLGLTVSGRRDTPIDKSVLSKGAQQNCPHMQQWVIIDDSAASSDNASLEDRLQLAHLLIEHAIKLKHPESNVHVNSLSTKHLAYKSLSSLSLLFACFPDLRDFKTNGYQADKYIVHTRYATNSFPEWAFAHPFLGLMHNGEFNSMTANLLNSESLEGEILFQHIENRFKVNLHHIALQSGLSEEQAKQLNRTYLKGGSDTLELARSAQVLSLALSLTKAEAVFMLMPPVIRDNPDFSDEERAFIDFLRQYTSSPVCGPAHVTCFDDFTALRNSYRPSVSALTNEQYATRLFADIFESRAKQSKTVWTKESKLQQIERDINTLLNAEGESDISRLCLSEAYRSVHNSAARLLQLEQAHTINHGLPLISITNLGERYKDIQASPEVLQSILLQYQNFLFQISQLAPEYKEMLLNRSTLSDQPDLDAALAASLAHLEGGRTFEGQALPADETMKTMTLTSEISVTPDHAQQGEVSYAQTPAGGINGLEYHADGTATTTTDVHALIQRLMAKTAFDYAAYQTSVVQVDPAPIDEQSELNDSQAVDNYLAYIRTSTLAGTTKKEAAYLDQLAEKGVAKTVAMGDDRRLDALSADPGYHSPSIYSLLREKFVMVSAPTNDPNKEQEDVDTSVFLGDNVALTPDNPYYRKLDSPILRFGEYASIVSDERLECSAPIAMYVGEEEDFKEAIHAVCQEAAKQVRLGKKTILLSHLGVTDNGILLPDVLVVGAVDKYLKDQGLRTKVKIIVQSSTAKDPHETGTLLAMGATAVDPHSVYQHISINHAIGHYPNKPSLTTLQNNAHKGLHRGHTLLMAKMGFTQSLSYIGSKGAVFEGLGIACQSDPWLANIFESTVDETFGILNTASLESLQKKHHRALKKICQNEELIDHRDPDAIRVKGFSDLWVKAFRTRILEERVHEKKQSKRLRDTLRTSCTNKRSLIAELHEKLAHHDLVRKHLEGLDDVEPTPSTPDRKAYIRFQKSALGYARKQIGQDDRDLSHNISQPEALTSLVKQRYHKLKITIEAINQWLDQHNDLSKEAQELVRQYKDDIQDLGTKTFRRKTYPLKTLLAGFPSHPEESATHSDDNELFHKLSLYTDAKGRLSLTGIRDDINIESFLPHLQKSEDEELDYAFGKIGQAERRLKHILDLCGSEIDFSCSVFARQIWLKSQNLFTSDPVKIPEKSALFEQHFKLLYDELSTHRPYRQWLIENGYPKKYLKEEDPEQLEPVGAIDPFYDIQFPLSNARNIFSQFLKIRSEGKLPGVEQRGRDRVSVFDRVSQADRDHYKTTKASKEYFAQMAQIEEKYPATLYDYIDVQSPLFPVELNDVMSSTEMGTAFRSGAMSFGSLTAPAHHDVAKANNVEDRDSCDGEGGLPQQLYGTSSSGKTKQIASGHFGVDCWLIYDAETGEIKIVQGAKPGVGGKLPGDKVNLIVAIARHCLPGITLESPPPHHNIYSIEDLKGLVMGLRAAGVDVGVKLASTKNIGTIACGVAKSGAQKISIACHSGGTGAATHYDQADSGLPGVIGVKRAHDALVQNGLRNNVDLCVSGSFKSVRHFLKHFFYTDHVESGTIQLAGGGCIMMDQCFMAALRDVKDFTDGGCSVGVTNSLYRYKGRDTEISQLTNDFIAELRVEMANMGFRSFKDMKRTNIIRIRQAIKQAKFTDQEIRPSLILPKTCQTFEYADETKNIWHETYQAGYQGLFQALQTLNKKKSVNPKELSQFLRNSSEVTGHILSHTKHKALLNELKKDEATIDWEMVRTTLNDTHAHFLEFVTETQSVIAHAIGIEQTLSLMQALEKQNIDDITSILYPGNNKRIEKTFSHAQLSSQTVIPSEYLSLFEPHEAGLKHKLLTPSDDERQEQQRRKELSNHIEKKRHALLENLLGFINIIETNPKQFDLTSFQAFLKRYDSLIAHSVGINNLKKMQGCTNAQDLIYLLCHCLPVDISMRLPKYIDSKDNEGLRRFADEMASIPGYRTLYDPDGKPIPIYFDELESRQDLMLARELRQVIKHNTIPDNSQYIDSFQNGVIRTKPISLDTTDAAFGASFIAQSIYALLRDDNPYNIKDIVINTRGNTGQSYAFNIGPNTTLHHEGYIQDYGLSGLAKGSIVTLRPYASCAQEYADTMPVAGNSVLYGSRGGKVYIQGSVPGERFNIRGSGTQLVVTGHLGSKACEYFTLGCVVVLGNVGPSFGDGMSGGVAVLYNPQRQNEQSKSRYLHDKSVTPVNDLLTGGDKTEYLEAIKYMLQQTAHYTNSPKAKEILEHWQTEKEHFDIILPRSLIELRTKLSAFDQSAQDGTLDRVENKIYAKLLIQIQEMVQLYTSPTVDISPLETVWLQQLLDVVRRQEELPLRPDTHRLSADQFNHNRESNLRIEPKLQHFLLTTLPKRYAFDVKKIKKEGERGYEEDAKDSQEVRDRFANSRSASALSYNSRSTSALSYTLDTPGPSRAETPMPTIFILPEEEKPKTLAQMFKEAIMNKPSCACGAATCQGDDGCPLGRSTQLGARQAEHAMRYLITSIIEQKNYEQFFKAMLEKRIAPPERTVTTQENVLLSSALVKDKLRTAYTINDDDVWELALWMLQNNCLLPKQKLLFAMAYEKYAYVSPFLLTANVCPAPCETGCTKETGPSPVPVRTYEQLLFEFAEGVMTVGSTGETARAIYNKVNQFQVPESTTLKGKIAIIGSGPSAMQAAWRAALKGHQVVIYEADDKPGGLATYGIPDEKGAHKMINTYYERLMGMTLQGKRLIDVQCHQNINSIDQLQGEGYEHVIVATGVAKTPKWLNKSINVLDENQRIVRTYEDINFNDIYQGKDTLNPGSVTIEPMSDGSAASAVVAENSQPLSGFVQAMDLLKKINKLEQDPTPFNDRHPEFKTFKTQMNQLLGRNIVVIGSGDTGTDNLTSLIKLFKWGVLDPNQVDLTIIKRDINLGPRAQIGTETSTKASERETKNRKEAVEALHNIYLDAHPVGGDHFRELKLHNPTSYVIDQNGQLQSIKCELCKAQQPQLSKGHRSLTPTGNTTIVRASSLIQAVGFNKPMPGKTSLTKGYHYEENNDNPYELTEDINASADAASSPHSKSSKLYLVGAAHPNVTDLVVSAQASANQCMDQLLQSKRTLHQAQRKLPSLEKESPPMKDIEDVQTPDRVVDPSKRPKEKLNQVSLSELATQRNMVTAK